MRLRGLDIGISPQALVARLRRVVPLSSRQRARSLQKVSASNETALIPIRSTVSAPRSQSRMCTRLACMMSPYSICLLPSDPRQGLPLDWSQGGDERFKPPAREFCARPPGLGEAERLTPRGGAARRPFLLLLSVRRAPG